MVLNVLKYILLLLMMTFCCAKFSTFPDIMAAYQFKSFHWHIDENSCYYQGKQMLPIFRFCSVMPKNCEQDSVLSVEIVFECEQGKYTT